MSASAKKKTYQPVKVYVRQRPFTEQEWNCSNIIQQLTNNELIIKWGLSERRYGFDQVFDEATTQGEIFDSVVAPLITCIISGYNCTVFAYGQTGTGKTYTMVGDTTADSSLGLIPRSAVQLFDALDRIDAKIEYTVRVSFIEIYNEEVRDLLDDANSPLKIFDDPENRGSVHLRGVKEATVFTAEDVCNCLNAGLSGRQTAATSMNRQSSRSHSIFTLSVLTREVTLDGDEVIKNGKLYLVDLAGSENVGRSGSTELRAREAGNINKSLLTLGKVIKALAQKAPHVPYRDSKLTRILQDSLGGKTKTCMIATISAASGGWDETVSTLDYAQVARNVSNCPQVNENRKQANVLKDLKDEIGRLRKELAVARTGDGFFLTTESYDGMCEALKRFRRDVDVKNNTIATLKQKIEELDAVVRTSNAKFQKLNERHNDVLCELDEKERLLKRDQYVLNYMEKRDEELKSAADQLWKVCEVSTKHETLFSQKYTKQCEATMRNATAANNAYSIVDDSLQTLQNVTKDHTQNQSVCLEQVRGNVACLKEKAWDMCKRLSEYSKRIDEERRVDVDADEFCYQFQKYLERNLDDVVGGERENKAVYILDSFNKKKSLEIESMSTRCVNGVKQLLNDYLLCVADAMNAQSSLIENVKNEIARDEAVMFEKIEEEKKQIGQFFKQLVEAFDTRIGSSLDDIKRVNREHAQKIEHVQTQFRVLTGNVVNNVVESLKSVENNETSYEDTVKKCKLETLQKLKKELENVQFGAHVGDTPVKELYALPKKVDEKLSRNVLYELFEDNKQ